ncbi:pilus assembly protein [Telluria mixta]|uniref:Pilus assembly protein n=1 Tax=Telluria mixta TaxID=34071 RepID=A0ABT2BZD5_9BURK|nr:TadE family protein [Telluria mixta]MCS0630491.1 pilus assembly protein [Telluria mixta]WEM94205.1 pilus assembly protein [Telluria mixta]
MRATKLPVRALARRTREQGVAAVEFAIVAIVFFLFVFGIIEIARAMYICNTLQEVTRRAAALAATADFSSTSAMQAVRQQAVFRDSPGLLLFAEPVTDDYVKIDYMSIQKSGSTLTMTPIPSGTLPSSPAVNYANCLKDPYAGNCIRLVRVRVCKPDGSQTCTRAPYQALVSMIPLSFDLPQSTTIVNAETLGLPGGVPPDPCGCP